MFAKHEVHGIKQTQKKDNNKKDAVWDELHKPDATRS